MRRVPEPIEETSAEWCRRGPKLPLNESILASDYVVPHILELKDYVFFGVTEFS